MSADSQVWAALIVWRTRRSPNPGKRRGCGAPSVSLGSSLGMADGAPQKSTSLSTSEDSAELPLNHSESDRKLVGKSAGGTGTKRVFLVPRRFSSKDKVFPLLYLDQKYLRPQAEKCCPLLWEQMAGGLLYSPQDCGLVDVSEDRLSA